MLDFSAYITERTKDFTGREWVFAELDRWLVTPEAPHFFVITGEPGIGKTAIAARLTQVRKIAAYHFCIARQAETLDPLTWVRALAEQLARLHEFTHCLLAEKGVQIEVKMEVQENRGQIIGVQINHLTVEAPSATAAFNRAVLDPLRRLYVGGYQRQIVVLVDALDEAVQYIGVETIVDVLANCGPLPEPVRFVLTSRPEGVVLRHFQERKIPHLVLDASGAKNQADLRAYVRERLAASETLQRRLAGLAVETFIDRLSAASRGNFLYLVWVLRAVAEGTQALDRLEALPVGLDGIYREFLRTRKIGKDVERWRSYRPVLGVLAAARAPLTVAQVERFTKLDAQAVVDVLQDTQQFLAVQPGQDGECYQLYHQSLVNFLSDKERAGEFWIDVPSMHRHIVDEYAANYKGNWEQCDGYGLQHLAAHLAAAGAGERLKALLLDFNWLQAKLVAADVNALIGDYTLAGNDHDLRLVQGALRLSAHVLARDKNQLAGQLLGQLLSFDEPAIKAMLAQVQQWHGVQAWLRPKTASLTPPGGPLVRTLKGDMDQVNAVAVTPDGQRAVTVSDSGGLTLEPRIGELKVWDLTTGTIMYTLTSHVTAVAVTPDGRQAVLASENGILELWDLVNRAKIGTLTGHTDMVTAVVVTKDGRLAISASKDKTLKVWNLASGTELYTLTGHTDAVTAVAVTADRRLVVSASADKTLKVWNLTSGVELRTLTGHTEAVTAVAVTPNGQQAVSASADKTLKVWDLATGAELCTLSGHRSKIIAVVVTRDGRQTVSASWDTLKVWELASGAELRTLTGHTGMVTAMAVTPDGQRAVSASADELLLWDLASGVERRTLTGHTDAVTTVVITLDGRLAVSASADKTLKVWNLTSGTELCTLTGHTDAVTAVAVTPDGRLAVSASADKTLKVWNLANGTELRTLTGYTGAMTAVAVTPDGRLVVSGSSEGVLQVWDLASGAKLRTIRGHREAVRVAAMTPDGRQAVSVSVDLAGMGELKVWDLEYGSGTEWRNHMRHIDTTRAVAVTPDGRWAVLGTHQSEALNVLDLASMRTVCTLAGHYHSAGELAITPDGRWAVSVAPIKLDDGSWDYRPKSQPDEMKVWNLASGEELCTLAGHRGKVREVTVTPDGRQVVSAWDDLTLEVWKPAEDNQQQGPGTFGRSIAVQAVAALTLSAAVTTCAVSPNGRTIVVGDRLGGVHFVEWVDGDEIPMPEIDQENDEMHSDWDEDYIPF